MSTGATPGDVPPAAANLRDLGDLRLTNGGRTRAGVLYRSDCPFPDGDPSSLVAVWPPASVVDLRFDDEIEAFPTAWPVGVRRTHAPPYSPDVLRGLVPGTSLPDLYLHILDSSVDGLVAAAAAAMTAAAPVLVHCRAGKDRTGLVVALLLLLGGVEPDDVIADYLRTGSNLRRIAARQLPAGRTDELGLVQPQWNHAPAAAIEAALEWLDAHGGVETVWLGHGGDPAVARDWRSTLEARPDPVLPPQGGSVA